jgi:hypothetical protein
MGSGVGSPALGGKLQVRLRGEGKADLETRRCTGERLWVEAVAPTPGATNNPDRGTGSRTAAFDRSPSSSS